MSAPEKPVHMPCLSVVMPCFNEIETIEAIVKRVLESPFTQELIIVDDGSTDGTRDILERLDDPKVRVLLQPRNQGKGAALRRGFQAARAPFVMVQDADLEYDPDEYDTVLAPLLGDEADVVYGSRFLTGRPHRVLYFWHSMGNRLLTLTSNFFTNLNLSDMETCYKVFRREVIQSIEIEEDRFGFEPEITAKVAKANWRIWEVGISYAGRTYDEGKKIGWRDGVRALVCIVKYSKLADRFRRGRRSGTPHDTEKANEELRDVLDSLSGADNYVDMLHEHIRPHTRGCILEVGAGLGDMTTRLAEDGRVSATDISDHCLDALDDEFADDPRVEVFRYDVTDGPLDRTYDSIVLVNVLEHIEDDVTALRTLGGMLPPDGEIAVLVPAFDSLYSDFDRIIGHHRRYTKGTLTKAMASAGLDVVDARYVSAIGWVSWFLAVKTLGLTPRQGPLVRVYDRIIVPVMRWIERRWNPTFGQSVLCIGRPHPPETPSA